MRQPGVRLASRKPWPLLWDLRSLILKTLFQGEKTSEHPAASGRAIYPSTKAYLTTPARVHGGVAWPEPPCFYLFHAKPDKFGSSDSVIEVTRREPKSIYCSVSRAFSDIREQMAYQRNSQISMRKPRRVREIQVDSAAIVEVIRGLTTIRSDTCISSDRTVGLVELKTSAALLNLRYAPSVTSSSIIALHFFNR
jgi:hypothetical protein